MPVIILLIIGAILLALLIGTLLKNSRKFDTVVNEITEEQDIAPKKTDGVIKDISAAEKALQATAKAQKAEADKLQKESTRIGDYLTDRGVVKPKKGKEADGNEVT